MTYRYVVRAGTEPDAAAVAALFSTELSPRTPCSIAEIVQAGTVTLAEADGVLVGACTALPIEAEKAFPVGFSHLAQELGLPARVGLVKSVVVIPCFRRSGLGTELVRRSVAALATEVEVMVSLAWKRPVGKAPASSFLVAAGLAPKAAVPGLWSVEAVEEGYTCRYHPERCVCVGVVHVGRVDARRPLAQV